MSKKLFGTDGIRGKANIPPMDPLSMLSVAIATAAFFREQGITSVVIGNDTRRPNYALRDTWSGGMMAAGMNVLQAGTLSTPALSLLTRSLPDVVGAMLSASHNPAEDVGVKLFGPDGYKLCDRTEAEIARRAEGDLSQYLVPPALIGRAKRIEGIGERYHQAVLSTVKGTSLKGFRVVIDCANGAAYRIAPAVLRELGAEVFTIGVDPDGCNINQHVGATHPEELQYRVRKLRADVGIALDGDADRVIMVDEEGALIDGDQVLATVAYVWKKHRKLRSKVIVGTVMSNLGLANYLTKLGLTLVRTQVGDRYVVDAMRENKAQLGGEQSGHIVFSDFTTTGDGLVTALQVLTLFTGRNGTRYRASEVCRRFEQAPQELRNVALCDMHVLEKPTVQQAIAAAMEAVGRDNVVVRRSGTEPLVRVMVQHEDRSTMKRHLEAIVRAITDVY